jgi:hypothetical protein
MTRLSAQEAAALGIELPSAAPSRKRGTNSESAIQGAILDYLLARGLVAYRINSGAVKTETGGFFRGAPVGHPDLVAILPPMGRLWYIEVKTATGKQTAHQQAFAAKASAAGALVTVARRIEDVEVVLKEVLR